MLCYYLSNSDRYTAASTSEEQTKIESGYYPNFVGCVSDSVTHLSGLVRYAVANAPYELLIFFRSFQFCKAIGRAIALVSFPGPTDNYKSEMLLCPMLVGPMPHGSSEPQRASSGEPCRRRSLGCPSLWGEGNRNLMQFL